MYCENCDCENCLRVNPTYKVRGRKRTGSGNFWSPWVRHTGDVEVDSIDRDEILREAHRHFDKPNWEYHFDAYYDVERPPTNVDAPLIDIFSDFRWKQFPY